MAPAVTHPAPLDERAEYYSSDIAPKSVGDDPSVATSASAFAFGDAARDVVLGRLVVLAAVQRDCVQCAVELVSPASAPIPASSGQTRRHRLSRGGDRQGPVVAAQLIVAWSHHGRLRSEACFARDAGLVEQCWCECAHVCEHLALSSAARQSG